MAEKAVPVTETVVDQHLKPFIEENAEEIRSGIEHFAKNDLLPAAGDIKKNLPRLAEEFTEGELKPGAQRLAHEIEMQVPHFFGPHIMTDFAAFTMRNLCLFNYQMCLMLQTNLRVIHSIDRRCRFKVVCAEQHSLSVSDKSSFLCLFNKTSTYGSGAVDSIRVV